MSYLVLARKYRPQKFSDLVGQEPVAKTLKNAISLKKTAHAYLFSGPRGVGKTTSARIFAKALNCKNGPIPEPCGECQNCIEITEGRSLDVIEIDAASNRGIDDIRSLRENVKFTPATSTHKIYIIDEAHQISHDAFNALLKTLEEPPSHVVFILATTEPQKIPLTILSRCQRYRFRLIPFDEILRYIGRLAQKEGFKIADEALKLVVKAAGGSLRDGLSLMDQVASFASGEIGLSDVQYVLGYLPSELLNDFIATVVDRNIQSALEQVSIVAEGGYDLYQLASDLREYFRKMLIVASGNEPKDESQESIAFLRAVSKRFGIPEIIRDMRLLSRCLDEMRWSEQPRLLLEMYTARLVEPYVDLKELADKIEASPALPVKSVSSIPIPVKTTKQNTNPQQEDTVLASDSAVPESETSCWQSVVHEVEKSKPSLAACLKESSFTRITQNQWKLTFAQQYTCDFVKRNIEYLKKLVQKICNKTVSIDFELETHSVKETMEMVESEEPESPVISSIKPVVEEQVEVVHHPEDDPGVQKVLEVFPGKVLF
ncbi:MAG: DNA polymerase III subunit gamma/tau [bacterium]